MPGIFLIHQLSSHYEQKAVDSYVAEPFRGIDWQIQQMTDAGNGLLGTEEEWQQVVNRALATPPFLTIAKANLVAGKQSRNMPDKRMVQRDGVNGSKDNAEYFRTTLATTARGFVGNRSFGSAMLARLTSAGATAAQAWADFAAFLSANFDVNESVDRFAVGETEYEWRVHNVLRDSRSTAQLFQYGRDQVDLYTNRIYEIARTVAAAGINDEQFAGEAFQAGQAGRKIDFLVVGQDHDRDARAHGADHSNSFLCRVKMSGEVSPVLRPLPGRQEHR